MTVAFLVGSTMGTFRWAAMAGMLTLLFAVGGYYAAAAAAGAGVSTSSLVIWGGTAIVGGPVFGGAGHAWRSATGRVRALAAALLGAVFLAEGLFTLAVVPEMAPAGWVEVVAGLVLVIVLPRSGRERAIGLVAIIPLALVGLAGFALIEQLFMMR